MCVQKNIPQGFEGYILPHQGKNSIQPDTVISDGWLTLVGGALTPATQITPAWFKLFILYLTLSHNVEYYADSSIQETVNGNVFET